VLSAPTVNIILNNLCLCSHSFQEKTNILYVSSIANDVSDRHDAVVRPSLVPRSKTGKTKIYPHISAHVQHPEADLKVCQTTARRRAKKQLSPEKD